MKDKTWFEDRSNIESMNKERQKTQKKIAIIKSKIFANLEEECDTYYMWRVINKLYEVNTHHIMNDKFLSNPIDENTWLVNPYGFYGLDWELNIDVYKNTRTYKISEDYIYKIYTVNGEDYVIDKSWNNHFQLIHKYFKWTIKEIFKFWDKILLIWKEGNWNYWIFDQDSNAAMQNDIWQIKKINYNNMNILMFEIARSSYWEMYEEYVYIWNDGKYYDRTWESEYIISPNQEYKNAFLQEINK